MDLLDRATQGRQGARTDIVDNVHEVERPTGNSEADASSLHHRATYREIIAVMYQTATVDNPMDLEKLRDHLRAMKDAALIQFARAASLRCKSNGGNQPRAAVEKLEAQAEWRHRHFGSSLTERL